LLLIKTFALADMVPDPKIPQELREVQIVEQLGKQVQIQDLSFLDEEGNSVQLSHYFAGKKPVILNLLYYGCPSLCGYFLNGFLATIKELKWSAGEDFEVVNISIDPREIPSMARGKKKSTIEAYGRQSGEAGMHFLTGEENSIKQLASQVGFGYRYDEKQKEYAHSSAAIVLTPGGVVSRYLHGIQFSPRDLRFALLEASEGKIGTLVDRVVMFCYRYDPSSRGYSLVVMKVMQAGSAGAVVVFGGFLAVFWRGESRRKKVKPNSSKGG